MSATHHLPALDCHAHIAPDVTAHQLTALGDVIVFAVTRDLGEAQAVVKRSDWQLVWGIGAHPAVATARATYDPDRFRALLPHFAYVGEVGLDHRAPLGDGRRVFTDILNACRDQPVLVSIHSAGRTPEVIGELERHRHPGAILHWFLGDGTQLSRAIKLGAYFSVNNAMDDDTIRAIPSDRILSETDFPARNVHARRPGDVIALEDRLAGVWGVTIQAVRQRLWLNLKKIAIDSGAIESLPDHIADTLIAT